MHSARKNVLSGVLTTYNIESNFILCQEAEVRYRKIYGRGGGGDC